MRAPVAVLVASLALVAAARGAAQDPPSPPDVAALLEPIRAAAGVPALGACVLVGREVVATGATGVRARGDDAAVTADDLWHLGSCTKAMTATLCATFVEAGQLRWDTTLEEGFPDLAERIHADLRGVTVRHLLQHRAGLRPNPDGDGLWRELYAWEGTPRAAREHVVRAVLAEAPEHPPGSAFLYSNTGYVVVGALLERLADRSWEELMRARVFAPLGITTAGFGPPGRADVVDQPRAHRGALRGIPPGPRADNPTALGPAGTVHMSLGDWARFVALHLGTVDGDAAIVAPGTLAALQTGVAREGADPYALGWAVTERGWAKGPVLTHSGSNTMWFAVVWAAPDEDFAVLAVCNQGGDAAAAATDRACAALIGAFGPRTRDAGR